MEPLSSWLNKPEIARLRSLPLGEYLQLYFLRDPFRSIKVDTSVMYSPADGVILYAMEAGPDDAVVNIKGQRLTVREILRDPSYNSKSIIIGIMMTVYDVHFNRMPTSGIISFRFKDKLRVDNLSMIPVEQALLSNQPINPDSLEYMLYNERQVCEVNDVYNKLKYYIVQVADLEVDAIANLVSSGSFLEQGERFSIVLLGSQVDLIVPLSGRHKLTNLVADKVLWHVEAGVDPLIKITVI